MSRTHVILVHGVGSHSADYLKGQVDALPIIQGDHSMVVHPFDWSKIHPAPSADDAWPRLNHLAIMLRNVALIRSETPRWWAVARADALLTATLQVVSLLGPAAVVFALGGLGFAACYRHKDPIWGKPEGLVHYADAITSMFLVDSRYLATSGVAVAGAWIALLVTVSLASIGAALPQGGRNGLREGVRRAAVTNMWPLIFMTTIAFGVDRKSLAKVYGFALLWLVMLPFLDTSESMQTTQLVIRLAEYFAVGTIAGVVIVGAAHVTALYASPLMKVVGDVVVYLGDADFRQGVRNELAAFVGRQDIQPDDHLILAGHSLGSVICADLVQHEPLVRCRITLVTAGSPLARLIGSWFPSLRLSPREVVAQGRRRHASFTWVNVYRPMDPIGGDLGEHDAIYNVRSPQWRDPVRSHTGYWGDSTIGSLVANAVRNAAAKGSGAPQVAHPDDADVAAVVINRPLSPATRWTCRALAMAPVVIAMTNALYITPEQDTRRAVARVNNLLAHGVSSSGALTHYQIEAWAPSEVIPHGSESEEVFCLVLPDKTSPRNIRLSTRMHSEDAMASAMPRTTHRDGVCVDGRGQESLPVSEPRAVAAMIDDSGHALVPAFAKTEHEIRIYSHLSCIWQFIIALMLAIPCRLFLWPPARALAGVPETEAKFDLFS
jgi:hypothetical protein